MEVGDLGIAVLFLLPFAVFLLFRQGNMNRNIITIFLLSS